MNKQTTYIANLILNPRVNKQTTYIDNFIIIYVIANDYKYLHECFNLTQKTFPPELLYILHIMTFFSEKGMSDSLYCLSKLNVYAMTKSLYKVSSNMALKEHFPTDCLTQQMGKHDSMHWSTVCALDKHIHIFVHANAHLTGYTSTFTSC